MTNIDRATHIINETYADEYVRAHMTPAKVAAALNDAALLAPDTVLCIDREFATFQYADCTVSEELPAVVIRDGAEVRAALNALEKEN